MIGKYIQKFLIIQKIYINKFLNNVYDDFTMFELNDFIKDIKEKNKKKNNLFTFCNTKKKSYYNYTYTISKEISTDSWYLFAPNLFIITLSHEDYFKIKQYFINSIYKFKVYKTITNYTLICISHHLSEIKELKQYLYIHKCFIHYIILSNLLGPFILLNEGYLDTTIVETKTEETIQAIKEFYNTNIKYIETIGNGCKINKLEEFTNIIIEIKKLYKTTPKHNLIL